MVTFYFGWHFYDFEKFTKVLAFLKALRGSRSARDLSDADIFLVAISTF